MPPSLQRYSPSGVWPAFTSEPTAACCTGFRQALPWRLVIDVRTSSERRATNGSPASRESAMDSSAHYFREHQ